MDLNATAIHNLVDGNDHSVSLKLSDLRNLECSMNRLKSDLESRIAETSKLMHEIYPLYEILSISEDDRIFSTDDMRTYNWTVLEENQQRLRDEFEKLKIMKRVNLEKINQNQLSQIRKLWNVAMIGENTQNKYMSLNVTISGEVIENNEMKIKELENYIVQHESTLEKVGVFVERCQLAEDLKKRMEDQNRLFTSRGNSMAKEEKDRKKVNEIPTLSEELLRLAEENGNIEVYDVPLDTLIEDHIAEFNHLYCNAASKSAVSSGTTRSGRSFTTKTNVTASPRSSRRGGRLITTPARRKTNALSMTRNKAIGKAKESLTRKKISHYGKPQILVDSVDESLVNDTVDQTLFTRHVQYNSTVLSRVGLSAVASIGPEQDNTVVLSGHIDMLVAARNKAERSGSGSSPGNNY